MYWPARELSLCMCTMCTVTLSSTTLLPVPYNYLCVGLDTGWARVRVRQTDGTRGSKGVGDSNNRGNIVLSDKDIQRC